MDESECMICCNQFDKERLYCYGACGHSGSCLRPIDSSFDGPSVIMSVSDYVSCRSVQYLFHENASSAAEHDLPELQDRVRTASLLGDSWIVIWPVHYLGRKCRSRL
jgi:hypothetical protein